MSYEVDMDKGDIEFDKDGSMPDEVDGDVLMDEIKRNVRRELRELGVGDKSIVKQYDEPKSIFSRESTIQKMRSLKIHPKQSDNDVIEELMKWYLQTRSKGNIIDGVELKGAQ